MIYQIFIWHRFQPIICLTRDLTTLDTMLLRSEAKDSRAGFFLRPIHRKKEDKWVPAWGCAGRRTGGLKIRTVRPKSGRVATLGLMQVLTVNWYYSKQKTMWWEQYTMQAKFKLVFYAWALLLNVVRTWMPGFLKSGSALLSLAQNLIKDRQAS